MAEWILILTLTGGYRGNFVIEHVPGFTSEQACEQAGKRWQENLPKQKLGNTDGKATCVKLR